MDRDISEKLPNKCHTLRQRSIRKRIETERNKDLPKQRKPRERPAPLSKYRRKTANARERQRMHEVNLAFDRLKLSIPHHKLKQIDEKKDTKITTLRCAITYINSLSELLTDLNTGKSVSPEYYFTDAQLGIAPETTEGGKRRGNKGKGRRKGKKGSVRKSSHSSNGGRGSLKRKSKTTTKSSIARLLLNGSSSSLNTASTSSIIRPVVIAKRAQPKIAAVNTSSSSSSLSSTTPSPTSSTASSTPTNGLLSSQNNNNNNNNNNIVPVSYTHLTLPTTPYV